MKIGLGTVQFGMDYGVSNQAGKTKQEEVKLILKKALEVGIRKLDTAYLYGESETVLGQNPKELNHFEVITKTRKFVSGSITKEDGLLIRNSFFESLSRLKLNKVYGLMIHDSSDLLKENSGYLWDELVTLRTEGKVSKIGVSVYSPVQTEEILKKFPIEIIQFPLNIYDQSFLQNGFLTKLKKLDIEIHIRSVFLQGMALMSYNELPSYFKSIRNHIKECQEMLRKLDVSLVEVALDFIKSVKEVDFAILGFNNASQLLETINSYHSKTKFTGIDYSKFAIFDDNITNPSKWKIT
ncbi:oxidoreductase, aldo/keto reductase family protein [Leptospira yanagawae serovar Saopaulo str. Sao Paulo = ATCC 700523]|uniref:Oxidoreductase, aldo/keto reductase family protein n=1 Tax=Leptospira yanagawae serovar Saopaulo str. Sao Paulo = ATCC 700523 TaxID=1249483 RepID=A0A5E8HBE7_9LEPT|nr:aldo/keto reductase [Leptospira yanagawae]EOQ88172.1 oxidoreductase, aldo/keto reductase family protein [Leptospira yanagawae serovar Saopaulo str. Sao Paulo = ATCC 700523]